MALNLATVFPPEIITHIVSYIDVEDYVFLKLSCKAMAAYMPQSLPDRLRIKWPDCPEVRSELRGVALTFFTVHGTLESRARGLLGAEEVDLLCMWCGLVKPQQAFADKDRAQVAIPPLPPSHEPWWSARRGRHCVNCKILHIWRPGKYSHRHNGRARFGCSACLQMQPMKDLVRECNETYQIWTQYDIHNLLGRSEIAKLGGVCRGCVDRVKKDKSYVIDVGERIKRLVEVDKTELAWRGRF